MLRGTAVRTPPPPPPATLAPATVVLLVLVQADPPPKPRLPPLNPLRHSPLIKIQGRMKKSVVPIATPTERCLRLKCHWSACESKIGAARLGRCCKVRKSLREFLTRTKQRQKNKMVQFHVKLNDLLGVLRFTLVFWHRGFESNC